MIELLSRLDPGTSPYLGEMQGDASNRYKNDPEAAEKAKLAKDAARLERCPTCRGRKRLKDPRILGAPETFSTCQRCHGTGKSASDLSNIGTRARKSISILTPEQIAFCTAGMPEHWYRAAVVHVTHDIGIRRILVCDIQEKIVMPNSKDWKLSPEMTQARALGLSRVVSVNLMLNDQRLLRGDQAADLMCCLTKTWDKTWREKAHEATKTARGWIVSADEYMANKRIAA